MGEASSGASKPDMIHLLDQFGDVINPATEETLEEIANLLAAIPGLVPFAYDYVAVTATNANGDPTVIQFRTGGSSGTLVRTITITYDGNGNFATATAT